jgi:hypothetical protein
MISFFTVRIWKRVVLMQTKGPPFSITHPKIVANKHDKNKPIPNYFLQ